MCTKSTSTVTVDFLLPWSNASSNLSKTRPRPSSNIICPRKSTSDRSQNLISRSTSSTGNSPLRCFKNWSRTRCTAVSTSNTIAIRHHWNCTVPRGSLTRREPPWITLEMWTEDLVLAEVSKIEIILSRIRRSRRLKLSFRVKYYVISF